MESISNEAEKQHEEQKNADFLDVFDSENEDEVEKITILKIYEDVRKSFRWCLNV